MKKGIWSICIVVGLFCVLASEVLAEDNLVVMDLKPIGVDTVLAEAVSENLRTMIIQTKIYNVIERSQVEKLLAEHEFSLTGVTEDKTALKIGQLANADLIMLGSLNKISEIYTITVRVLDVESGVVTLAKKVRCASEAQLPRKIDELALLVTGSEPEEIQEIEHYNIVGTYKVKGAKYHGVLDIRQNNTVYLIFWKIGSYTAEGVGILKNGILSVSYQDVNGKHGVVNYEILLGGDRLRGLWTTFDNAQKYGTLAFENGEKVQ